MEMHGDGRSWIWDGKFFGARSKPPESEDMKVSDLKPGDTIRVTDERVIFDRNQVITILNVNEDGNAEFEIDGALWTITDGLAFERVFAYSDAVDPDHYRFPGGIETRQISAHLTSLGGQALQYIARSTRLDGRIKGDPVTDLRKAIRLLEWEIERIEANG